MQTYIPQRGDFVAVSFDPQSGHEQKGQRPALVLSKSLFSAATGLAIVCPITNTDRRVPFHVAIEDVPGVTGFVMVEQAKSLDFRTRKAKLIGRAPERILLEALSILDACLF